jgi:hypothetical protein
MTICKMLSGISAIGDKQGPMLPTLTDGVKEEFEVHPVSNDCLDENDGPCVGHVDVSELMELDREW